MHVDVHLEDLLQLAHDLYHLHVIKLRACARRASSNKDGARITLKDLVGVQLRTIQHGILVLNYINTRLIKTCTGAPRQLFEAG